MALTNAEMEQYRAAKEGCAVLSRADRGLMSVTGPDRAGWLHNLLTNNVKTLSRGDGVYAFAVNIKGRVVFDVNVLALDDASAPQGALWLDIDAGWVAEARKHLDRYIISEDVQVRDVSAEVARLAIVGPKCADLAAAVGVGNLRAMPALQWVACDAALFGATTCRLVRHDVTGDLGAEWFAPCEDAAQAQAVGSAMAQWATNHGAYTLTAAVADVLRIEANLPISRRDIDGDVTPPETGQIERGISYHKGCYLGQEVIERMRSHGVTPRKLVMLKLATTGMGAESGKGLPMPIWVGGSEVGRATSACWSPRHGGWIALGYVKSAHIAAGKAVRVGLSAADAWDGAIMPV